MTLIEIRITKEIGDYEPKFLGPFTLRKVICLSIAIPICFFLYQAGAKVLPVDLAGFICAIPAAAAWFFGWCKPYGLKPENFFRSVAINVLMAPTNRRYKTKNAHEDAIRLLEEAEAKRQAAELALKSKTEKMKKHVEKKAKSVKSKLSKDAEPEYYL